MRNIKGFEEFTELVGEGKDEGYASQFAAAVIKAADKARDVLRAPLFDHQDPPKPEVNELADQVRDVLEAIHSLYDKAVETHKKLK